MVTDSDIIIVIRYSLSVIALWCQCALRPATTITVSIDAHLPFHQYWSPLALSWQPIVFPMQLYLHREQTVETTVARIVI